MRANEDALARGGALRLAVEVRRRYDAMRCDSKPPKDALRRGMNECEMIGGC